MCFQDIKKASTSLFDTQPVSNEGTAQPKQNSALSSSISNTPASTGTGPQFAGAPSSMPGVNDLKRPSILRNRISLEDL